MLMLKLTRIDPLFRPILNCQFAAVAARVPSYPATKMPLMAALRPQKMFGQEDEDQLCSKFAEENNCKEKTKRQLNDRDYDYSDRWEFIRSLRNRLIRDIAFVIASPDLLLSSNELPTVSAEMLGGDTWKWNESKKWLEELDVEHVNDWFGARKCRTRLGDHFAACIEYVLRFSPVVQVERLIVSQQVREQMNFDVRHSFCQKGGLGSESNILGCVSKHSEETSTNRTHVSEVDEISTNRTDQVNTLQMSEGDFKVPLIAEIADDVAVDLGDSSDNQRQKNRLSKKKNKLKSTKNVIHTIGEFDFLFQLSYATQDTPKFTSSKQYAEGFENITQDASESDISYHTAFEKEVHHWEASVKFLLYAGPWEALGFESPDSATWKMKRLDDAQEESCLQEHGNQDNTFDSNIAIPNPSTMSEVAWGSNEILGCFLGPHVGETLYDRKSRLKNQLSLSQNPLAASFLQRTYATSECSEQMEFSKCFYDEHDSQEGNTLVVTQNNSVLKIVPGALLKGFLFYEYELWKLLRGNRAFNTCDLCSRLTLNSLKEQAIGPNAIVKSHFKRETSALPETNYYFECHHVKTKSTRSKLNSQHWMGWWTRIDDFAKFAESAAGKRSRWYIVPKQEWLSPVVINGSDVDRCAKVLTLEGFLAIAAKVAVEADLSKMPRKRRFMVAEVYWEVESTDPMGSQGQFEEGNNFVLHGCGAWTEASRGFVVEETWPDSRVYRPHGYVLSCSPTLQQGFK